MNKIETNLYPIYVNQDEADELCIQQGWYIDGLGSLRVNPQTGNPFGSEQEAADYISNSNHSSPTSED
ncbi:hypothetical protein [Aeromonas sobria]|uniref:hypothetical protein n=1 Tax=Aeromonas sobria TaxID=646 RepID=UPI003CFF7A1F